MFGFTKKKTIGDRLVDKLSDVDGWTVSGDGYRHPNCPFVVKQWCGMDYCHVAVVDDNGSGDSIPLTSREKRHIERSLAQIRHHLLNQRREAALQKFERECR